MARVLLADDESDFRASVAVALEDAGHEVRQCADGNEAFEFLRKETFDAVLADFRMPGRSGLELIREAAARLPDAVLIVLTAYGGMDSVIEALRIGAHDFLTKPVNLEALSRKVNILLQHQATSIENRFLRRALEIEPPPTGLVGSSPAINDVHRLIAKVAPTNSTVLITGETGTGKELVARAIHQASPRQDAPFVAINCGSIPETLLESELFGHVRGAFTGADRDKHGLLEVAGRGTILLDEIGEMPPSLQPKLLRVLEDREVMRVGGTRPIPVTATIFAATHQNLLEMAEAGRFRSDLYYRLNVFDIPVSPLRERAEDIRPIAEHLLEKICRRINVPLLALEPEALRTLEQYRWPGNVRELANVLERAVILSEGPRIRVTDLPGIMTSMSTSDALKTARQQFERSHILRVIAKCGGDKKRAAEALGVDISSLYRKLQE
ncbi:MAG: sigma-54-dependent transcriptional regulator [Planctomycetota bacterium]|jgi:DNA-binding NtrC family response regulator